MDLKRCALCGVLIVAAHFAAETLEFCEAHKPGREPVVDQSSRRQQEIARRWWDREREVWQAAARHVHNFNRGGMDNNATSSS